MYKHVICTSQIKQADDSDQSQSPGGGNSNYFLTRCAARGLKPLPISKDFSPSKNGRFDGFFEIFANPDTFLRVFPPQKRLILQFFKNFGAMGPSSKDFLTNMGPLSKDFG